MISFWPLFPFFPSSTGNLGLKFFKALFNEIFDENCFGGAAKKMSNSFTWNINSPNVISFWLFFHFPTLTGNIGLKFFKSLNEIQCIQLKHSMKFLMKTVLEVLQKKFPIALPEILIHPMVFVFGQFFPTSTGHLKWKFIKVLFTYLGAIEGYYVTF